MEDIIIDKNGLHIRHTEPEIECDAMVNLILGGISFQEIPEELRSLPQNEKVRIIIQREGKIV